MVADATLPATSRQLPVTTEPFVSAVTVVLPVGLPEATPDSASVQVNVTATGVVSIRCCRGPDGGALITGAVRSTLTVCEPVTVVPAWLAQLRVTTWFAPSVEYNAARWCCAYWRLMSRTAR